MVSNESPAVARRRLRLALRRAREEKGLTQGQVAEALEWSLSKVNRIESGDVTISHTDLHALLNLLDVTDVEAVERLTEDARASRRRGWWDDPEYREYLTTATVQLLQFESQASVIRTFQNTLVPGLLQTRTYADFVLNFWSEELPEAERMARLDIRMQRPKHVFDRLDPPKYLVILDESVVFREVGGPTVMADQLNEVLRMAESPRITVRIVPFAEAAPLALLGPFTIFNLGDEEDAVLYRETTWLDEIVHTREVIRRHRHVFEQLWEKSLSAEASDRLIRAHAATMLASMDRASMDRDRGFG
jgi:transcriptional regulator with XRE-family HTH domain